MLWCKQKQYVKGGSLIEVYMGWQWHCLHRGPGPQPPTPTPQEALVALSLGELCSDSPLTPGPAV